MGVIVFGTWFIQNHTCVHACLFCLNVCVQVCVYRCVCVCVCARARGHAYMRLVGKGGRSGVLELCENTYL